MLRIAMVLWDPDGSKLRGDLPFFLLAAYTIGILFPLSVPQTPHVQGMLGGVCACAA